MDSIISWQYQITLALSLPLIVGVCLILVIAMVKESKRLKAERHKMAAIINIASRRRR